MRRRPQGSRRPLAGLVRRPPRAWPPATEVVTGERLQSLADVTLLPRHVREFHRHVDRYARATVEYEDYGEIGGEAVERLSASRSLFVYTHELRPFIEHTWPRLEGRGYVVVTHNSDFEADGSYLPWLEATGAKLDRWLAQNVTVAHPKLVPLPIGIANSMWPHGNLKVLLRAISRHAGAPKPNLAFLNFNPHTHPDRQATWDALRATFPTMSSEPPAARRYAEYLGDLARHRFCVCPRGNGIDTHRVWECLYLGVVPVVARSTHTEHWASCGLPLVLVDDWAEVTPERLQTETGRLHSSAWPAPGHAQLRLSHYAEVVRGGGPRR